MTPLLSSGSVAANNPYKYSDAATVSTRLLAAGVLDVIPQMCRVEFFAEPVSCMPTEVLQLHTTLAPAQAS